MNNTNTDSSNFALCSWNAQKKSWMGNLDRTETGNTCQNDGNDNNAKDSYANLRNSIPVLNELFHIHQKIGEGAFSSVFLATLKSSNGQKKFALKHLIPTCHPERIERELKCLQELGGKNHVVSLELCLRNQNSVVFVMPYMRHDLFSEYIRDMNIEEIKDYMRALLSALKSVHRFNIIHRDVKPGNFLYDRINRRYLLVDFGLAERYTVESSRIKKETNTVSTEMQGAKRKRCDENRVNLQPDYKTVKKSADLKCCCFGKPRVCSLCLIKAKQVAPRAGTPGFRAPEVLLKHPAQTSAIDIWASGVMMLSILSVSQPFFRSRDDCTALVEITTIFGTSAMQKCAQKLGKKVIFSDNLPGINLVSLCQKLQTRNKSITYSKANSTCKKVLPAITYSKEAYDLLTKLLDLDYKTRITAEQALSHPFLS